MATPLIEVDRLTKRFGSAVAVNNISFAVEPGEIFGFLGPNGAGKTTTIKMLTGLVRPTSGRARLAGFDIVRQALQAKRVFGYVGRRFEPLNVLPAHLFICQPGTA